MSVEQRSGRSRIAALPDTQPESYPFTAPENGVPGIDEREDG
jgi:hypothetical protein